MHWAVTYSDCNNTDYISGDDAATAQDAERIARDARRLHFLAVTVRRTTQEEDRRLSLPRD
jgi:hypothetical protein